MTNAALKTISLAVNGSKHEAEVEPRQLLVYLTSAATRPRAARAPCCSTASR
jgi:hypothetical protein